VLAPGRGGTMSIKLDTGDMPGTLAAIEQVYTRFSGDYPFEYEFMDDRYDNMYKNEIRLGRAFNHFAALAVLLCCLGLLGLVSFTIDQSAREIAVRKVLGASVSSLVQRLSWKFIRGVVLANLIAWPLAYFGMNSWLRGFVYRIDIGLSSFVIAGSAAAVIAFLTVLARTSRAALSNPVDSLRHE
jgi:putative ABC transport system permease protein